MTTGHRQIRYVLFDLDGLLLDTENVYTRCIQLIVGRFNKVIVSAYINGLSVRFSPGL